MNPNETPREHIANALQILLSLPRSDRGTCLLWAEERAGLQRRLEAALMGLESKTQSGVRATSERMPNVDDECFI